jgi:hypothetical protein
MSKTTFQQLRARCAELGITPARSVAETQARIDHELACRASNDMVVGLLMQTNEMVLNLAREAAGEHVPTGVNFRDSSGLRAAYPVETIKAARQEPPAKRRWPRNGGGTISQNAPHGKWWRTPHHKENPHAPRAAASYRAARRNLGRQWRKDHQKQGTRS